jgi:hypothetical protein
LIGGHAAIRSAGETVTPAAGASDCSHLAVCAVRPSPVPRADDARRSPRKAWAPTLISRDAGVPAGAPLSSGRTPVREAGVLASATAEDAAATASGGTSVEPPAAAKARVGAAVGRAAPRRAAARAAAASMWGRAGGFFFRVEESSTCAWREERGAGDREGRVRATVLTAPPCERLVERSTLSRSACQGRCLRPPTVGHGAAAARVRGSVAARWASTTAAAACKT